MIWDYDPMVELLRSNDLVHLSWARALLAVEGIETVMLDAHMSAIEGSIGVLPRRLMVAVEDVERARRILEEARGGDD
jgi:hypothetical protein